MLLMLFGETPLGSASREALSPGKAFREEETPSVGISIRILLDPSIRKGEKRFATPRFEGEAKGLQARPAHSEG